MYFVNLNFKMIQLIIYVTVLNTAMKILASGSQSNLNEDSLHVYGATIQTSVAFEGGNHHWTSFGCKFQNHKSMLSDSLVGSSFVFS